MGDIDEKELSVRKLVRVVYGHFGRPQEAVTRQRLNRNYAKGIVRYDGAKIGKWEGGTFNLSGLGSTLKEKLDEAMARAADRKE